ncbi:MAG: ISLre2 family transposase [Dehalococcoidia bacterium]
MEISLPGSAAELKVFLQGLDRLLLEKALEWARKTYQAILEQVEQLIAEHRGKGLSIEHRRGVWHHTCLGVVRVHRRQYRDEKGCYRYILDEMMGMGKHCHMSLGVRELALEMATAMPYRRSAEVLRKASAIGLAHQTLWRLVARTADPYLEKAERELKWFLETGEVPDSEGKRAARLLVEADGVMLSLQREKERKAEVKLGIAYEGWEKVGKDRYRTTNKTAFAALGDGDSFWGGMSLKLHSKYDLSRVGDTIVGGDGARWVKEGADYVGGRFQLDYYHLHRELTAALGKDKQTKGRVWQAIKRGEAQTGLQLLAETLRGAKREQAEKVRHAYGYLQANLSGLRDYRLGLGPQEKGLRRSGAIEGNVDKLVVRRMKNQGLSWTVRGIRRLLCVRFLVLEGQLKNWLGWEGERKTGIDLPRKKMHRVVNQLSMQESDAWLKVGLPALYGPHASRPWAVALRGLSQRACL